MSRHPCEKLQCLYESLMSNTVKSENKPRGLYFSKALFEGRIFGGAYMRRGLFAFLNRLG